MVASPPSEVANRRHGSATAYHRVRTGRGTPTGAPHSPLHFPTAQSHRDRERVFVRGELPVPGPPAAASPWRPGVERGCVRRLRRGPHLPSGRGLTKPVARSVSGCDSLRWLLRCGGEPACKPSSVPRLSSRRRSSISGRRSPDGSSGRPEDWAARPLPFERPVARTLEPRPPIWPCSEQSLPRFTYRSRVAPRPATSLWHWSSPRGGRALPATLR